MGKTTEESHPLEPLPLDAEDQRLPGLAGEILLCRCGAQEAAELAVKLLQDGAVELGAPHVLLGDGNGEYISTPLREIDVFSRKTDLKEGKNREGSAG